MKKLLILIGLFITIFTSINPQEKEEEIIVKTGNEKIDLECPYETAEVSDTLHITVTSPVMFSIMHESGKWILNVEVESGLSCFPKMSKGIYHLYFTKGNIIIRAKKILFNPKDEESEHQDSD